MSQGVLKTQVTKWLSRFRGCRNQSEVRKGMTLWGVFSACSNTGGGLRQLSWQFQHIRVPWQKTMGQIQYKPSAFVPKTISWGNFSIVKKAPQLELRDYVQTHSKSRHNPQECKNCSWSSCEFWHTSEVQNREIAAIHFTDESLC